MAVDSTSLMASQAPPDMLLRSEENEKKHSPIPVEPSAPLDTSVTIQVVEKTEEGGESVKEVDPVNKTPPQEAALPGTIASVVVRKLSLGLDPGQS